MHNVYVRYVQRLLYEVMYSHLCYDRFISIAGGTVGVCEQQHIPMLVLGLYHFPSQHKKPNEPTNVTVRNTY